jgi:hypothetical protein
MTDSFIQGLDLTGLTVHDRLVYSGFRFDRSHCT